MALLSSAMSPEGTPPSAAHRPMGSTRRLVSFVLGGRRVPRGQESRSPGVGGAPSLPTGTRVPKRMESTGTTPDEHTITQACSSESPGATLSSMSVRTASSMWEGTLTLGHLSSDGLAHRLGGHCGASVPRCSAPLRRSGRGFPVAASGVHVALVGLAFVSSAFLRRASRSERRNVALESEPIWSEDYLARLGPAGRIGCAWHRLRHALR